jgi:hypothetical protein
MFDPEYDYCYLTPRIVSSWLKCLSLEREAFNWHRVKYHGFFIMNLVRFDAEVILVGL